MSRAIWLIPASLVVGAVAGPALIHGAVWVVAVWAALLGAL